MYYTKLNKIKFCLSDDVRNKYSSLNSRKREYFHRQVENSYLDDLLNKCNIVKNKKEFLESKLYNASHRKNSDMFLSEINLELMRLDFSKCRLYDDLKTKIN